MPAPPPDPPDSSAHPDPAGPADSSSPPPLSPAPPFLHYTPNPEPPPPLSSSTVLIRLLVIPMFVINALAGVAADRVTIPVPKAILLTIGNLAIPLAISMTARTKLSRNYATFVWAIGLLNVGVLWFWNVR